MQNKYNKLDFCFLEKALFFNIVNNSILFSVVLSLYFFIVTLNNDGSTFNSYVFYLNWFTLFL